MRKLSVCLAMLLGVLLVLPTFAASQPIPFTVPLTVQRVWTQDALGTEKTTFAPGEPIQFVAELINSYGGDLLASQETKLIMTTSFYHDIQPVDIPAGISIWTRNAIAPSAEDSYTVTVNAYDPFQGVWVAESAAFTVAQEELLPDIALPRASSSVAINPFSRETLDDRFTAIALQVPEFGGMFYGPDEQTLEVYLTTTSPVTVAAVRQAIGAVFGAAVPPRARIRALHGQYGFLQLRMWYLRMMGPMLRIPGVTFTDIDEAQNRLGIGIETPAVEARVVGQLRQLGIPREAVAIEVTGPTELLHPGPDTGAPLHTVQDRFSPRQGGYIIIRPRCGELNLGLTVGTLGFNALRLSSFGNVPGFITNSHNTAVWWGLDTSLGFPPTNFYQAPDLFPSELVGQETVDYPGFQGFPCPQGMRCRYSDSAFISYNPLVQWSLGALARTTGLTTSAAAPILTVAHPPPGPVQFLVNPGVWEIAAAPSTPYLVGLSLNKVGRTTGWTQGAIDKTDYAIPQLPSILAQAYCSNGNLDPIPTDASALLLSQYRVAHPAHDLADQGDSGSPVFRVLAFQVVELYGIVWARNEEHTAFIFSPIGGSPFQPAGIQTDLGPLEYVAPCPGPFEC